MTNPVKIEIDYIEEVEAEVWINGVYKVIELDSDYNKYLERVLTEYNNDWSIEEKDFRSDIDIDELKKVYGEEELLINYLKNK